MLEVPSNAGTFKTGEDAHVRAASQMTSTTRKPLVAIVDDDPSVCRALRRLLWTRKINTEIFTSGRDFLDTLRTVSSFEPECVILDMHMQDLGGLAVLRQLVQRAPRIPVVVLTACNDAQTRLEALASGAVSFFEKPLADDIHVFLDTLLGLIRPASGSA